MNPNDFEYPDTDKLVTLNQPEDTGPQVSIQKQASSGRSPEATKIKALKYDMVLDERSPGPKNLELALQDGQEEYVVNNIMTSDRIKRQEASKHLVMDQIEAGTLDEIPEFAIDLAAMGPDPTPEELYVKKASDLAKTLTSNPDIDAFEEEDPMGGVVISTPWEDEAARSEIANDLSEMMNTRNQDRGWGSWGLDFGKQLLELPSATNLIIDRGGTDTSSYLPGENIEERIRQLKALPPAEFKKQATAFAESLAENNILDAIEFTDALKQYSYADRMFRNAFFLATFIPGAGTFSKAKGLVKGTPKVAPPTFKAVAPSMYTELGSIKLKNIPDNIPRDVKPADPQDPSAPLIDDSPLDAPPRQKSQTPPAYQPARRDWTDEKFEITSVVNSVDPRDPKANTGDFAEIWYGDGTPANPHQIRIAEERIKKVWDEDTWWSLPADSYGYPRMPKTIIKSYDEMRDFVIQHELAHIDVRKEMFKNPDGSIHMPRYEASVSAEALVRMGKVSELYEWLSGTELESIITETLTRSRKHQAAQQAADIAEALSIPGSPLDEVLTNTGNVEEAAEMVSEAMLKRQRMSETLMGSEAPSSMKENVAELLSTTMSYSNPRIFITGNEAMGAGRIGDMITYGNVAWDTLVRATRSMRVNRLDPTIETRAADLTRQMLARRWPVAENSVMDVRYVPSEATPVNAPFLAVTLGNEQRLPFAARSTAYNFATNYLKLLPGSFKVRQVGGNFVIDTYKPVPENLNRIVDDVITTENTPGNTTLTWLKSQLGANLSQAPHQSRQRQAASQGAAALEAQIRTFYRPYEELTKTMSRKYMKALEKVMHINRVTERVPGDPRTRGQFFRNDAELESSYQRTHGRIPTQKEKDAYWRFVEGNDMDILFRSLNELKNKSIKGMEEHQITRVTADGPVSFEVEASVVDDHSWLNAEHNVDITLIDGNGAPKVYNLKRMSAQDRAELNTKLTSGDYKTLQPWDPKSKAVGTLTASDLPSAFIIVKNSNHTGQGALQLQKMVNYNPGFHTEYLQSWFMKQAQVRGGRFMSDLTALAGKSRKQLEKAAKHWEQARIYLRDGDARFAQYVTDHLDMSPQTFDNFFKKVDPVTGEVTGHLDLNTPFTIVRRGQNSLDGGTMVNGQTFDQAFPGGVDNDLDQFYNPSAEFGDPFTAERQPILFEVEERGTASRPLWGIREAEMFSPLYTQQAAMGKLIKSTQYNDLQMTAAQNYTEYFKGKLVYDGKPVTEWQLRKNPIFYLQNATIDWKSNPKEWVQAKTLRAQTLNLIGQPSWMAEGLDIFKQKLTEGIYSVGGQKALDTIPEKLIPTISDPMQYARSVAFHTKLGMFNVVQYFVQASAVMNIGVISPRFAPQSFVGSSLMARLSLTESDQIIDHFGDIAEKMGMGWNKTKFVEAKKWMDTMAFDRIGGEHAFRTTADDPVLHRGKLGQIFLDKGPVFFNAGERTVRLTAWNTSYLEYAAKYPEKVGRMTRDDIQKVAQRARTFTANMTRDSNAYWQQGLAGNFTQFWSYNIRMGELMIGKELSGAEKMRLMAGHMLLYGFTPAAGLAAYAETGDIDMAKNAILPWGEDLRLYAMKQGHDMDENLSGMLYQGMFSVAIEALTGHKLGIGDRYGLSPLEVFQNIKDNYKENDAITATIISAMGPSGNIIADIVKSAVPITKDLSDIVSGEAPGEDVLFLDIAHAVRDITGLTNAQKIYFILKGENWRTQKGNLQIEGKTATPLKEIVKVVTGVSDQETLDRFAMLEDSIASDEARYKIRQEAKRYVAHMYDAIKRGDQDAADAYKKQAQILVNMAGGSERSKFNILYPDDQNQVPSSQMLFEDWFGKLSMEEQKNVKELQMKKEAQ